MFNVFGFVENHQFFFCLCENNRCLTHITMIVGYVVMENNIENSDFLKTAHRNIEV